MQGCCGIDSAYGCIIGPWALLARLCLPSAVIFSLQAGILLSAGWFMGMISLVNLPVFVLLKSLPQGTNVMSGLFLRNEANSSEVVCCVAYTTGLTVEASRISTSFF